MKDLFKLQEKIDAGEEIEQSEQVEVMFQINEKINRLLKKVKNFDERIINLKWFVLIYGVIIILILVFK